MTGKNEEFFDVKGRAFFNKPFFNNILSTNIALYKYLAGVLFDGDMGRVVWASTDMMFRGRQTQLALRKSVGEPKTDLGVLDMPFCSFRLAQDGIQPNTDRNWWNPALNAKGMWIEELEGRFPLTPATINYEACFCCCHDSDLYFAQKNLIWESNKSDTIVETFVDAYSGGKTRALKNIAVLDISPHANPQFAERDWLEKNKIQTITMDFNLLLPTRLLTPISVESLLHRVCA